MRRKLIIDGNAVYEIDDECARQKEEQRRAARPDGDRRVRSDREKEDNRTAESAAGCARVRGKKRKL